MGLYLGAVQLMLWSDSQWVKHITRFDNHIYITQSYYKYILWSAMGIVTSYSPND